MLCLPWMRLTGCVCVQHLILLSNWIHAICALATRVNRLIEESFPMVPPLLVLIENVTPYSFPPPAFLSSRGEESATHGSISCRVRSKVVPISLSPWREFGLTLVCVCGAAVGCV